jgi:hypothetical protein
MRFPFLLLLGIPVAQIAELSREHKVAPRLAATLKSESEAPRPTFELTAARTSGGGSRWGPFEGWNRDPSRAGQADELPALWHMVYACGAQSTRVT